MAVIRAKLINFDQKKINDAVLGTSKKIIDDVALDLKNAIRVEAPVLTGNLRDSTAIENHDTKERLVRLVGSDENQFGNGSYGFDGAPYAPYVYYPGISRNYGGNPYIDRAFDRVNAILGGILKSFENSFKI